jgi:hypothetical protein
MAETEVFKPLEENLKTRPMTRTQPPKSGEVGTPTAS